MLQIVVTRDAQGFLQVLASAPEVQVLVLDTAVQVGDACLDVQGQPVRLAGLLEGMHRVDRDAVETLFFAVGQGLATAPHGQLRTHQANVQLRNFKHNVFGTSPTAAVPDNNLAG